MCEDKTTIDPISELMNTISHLFIVVALLEEHGEETEEIIWNLERTLKSLKLVHRWFIRNPDALQNDIFQNA